MRRTMILIFLYCVSSIANSAQTTAFTYQGSLKDGANPANGNYDFEFKLFDLASAGAQQGSTIQRPNVAVANGIFTVSLDFGSEVLPGADRFLEIGLKPAGNPGGFQQLLPRVSVRSAPYAIKSIYSAEAQNATSSALATLATNSQNLGGLPAGQYVVTSDPRLSDARPPTANSPSYIQNQTAGTQASSNFNISGIGTANIFNATSQFHLNGNHILSTFGTLNLLAGAFSGQSLTNGAQNAFFGGFSGASTTSGSNNSFFGTSAGVNNTTGGNNAFFGSGAGVANTTASANSFFGTSAGQSNTSGSNNAFFGGFAGQSNTTGASNSFFGRNAGVSTTGGSNNSFFGTEAGQDNTSGMTNSFFGHWAGRSTTTGGGNAFYGGSAGGINTSGASNSFFGASAGNSNTSGDSNTIIGSNADVASGNLTYATAIGADSVVTNNNTVVLGRSADTVRVPGSFASTGTISTNGNFIALGTGQVVGTLTVNTLGAATATHLCINASDVLSACSSSMRYKTNVAPFRSGLDILNKMRPVRFDWKGTNENDLGLIAEEVESIDPLLVTYNKENQVQGVKYDRIGVVLINAVKEQQEQIETQKKIIESQQIDATEQKAANQKLQAQIDELKSVVCTLQPDVKICKAKEK